MRRLIVRNLRQRRVQVASIAVSVAMSAMAFTALFLLYGGMSRGIELSAERSGAQLLVIPEDAESQLEESDFLFTGAPVGAYLSADVADEVGQIDGVLRTTVQFYGQTLSESCCSTSAATRIIGFDPTTDWVVTPYCDNDVSAGLAEDEVVIGCNVTGFESGEGSVLGRAVRVAATLDATGTYLDNAVLMDIDVLRGICAAEPQFSHYWDAYGEPAGLVSAVLVETVEGEQAAVAGRIGRYVDADVSVVVRSEVIADAQESLSLSFVVMLAAGAVLALASLLQLVTRFYSLVWERKAELALYRALGARIRDVRAVIGGEAAAVCGIGVVAGIAAGAALSPVMLGFLQGASAFPYVSLPIAVAAAGIAAIAALFFAMAAIAVVVPLRQVARLDPASAMQ